MARTDALNRLLDNISRTVIGKETVIRQAVACLLCRGHLLIEDIPGVGKTLLAKTISRSIQADFKRLQFTPDLLPTDITGGNIFNQQKGEFIFRQGPVFTQVLLADEINRASPRTQASLLECMEERQVSIEGVTRTLPDLFFVLATQNPIELQGTYPLPEAQLDRFYMKIRMGYLTPEQEVEVMNAQDRQHPLETLEPVLEVDDVLTLQQAVLDIEVEESLLLYMAQVVKSTREHKEVQLGASPRGVLALRRASQAMALIEDEPFVAPHHIKQIVYPVLRHRLILKPQSRLTGLTADKVLDDVLASVEVPIS